MGVDSTSLLSFARCSPCCGGLDVISWLATRSWRSPPRPCCLAPPHPSVSLQRSSSTTLVYITVMVSMLTTTMTTTPAIRPPVRMRWRHITSTWSLSCRRSVHCPGAPAERSFASSRIQALNKAAFTGSNEYRSILPAETLAAAPAGAVIISKSHCEATMAFAHAVLGTCCPRSVARFLLATVIDRSADPVLCRARRATAIPTGMKPCRRSRRSRRACRWRASCMTWSPSIRAVG